MEVGERFASAEGFEDAVLDHGEDGFKVGFAMGLVLETDGGGELAEGFGGDGFGMLLVNKLAECAGAGGEAKAAVGAGFGKNFRGCPVGHFGAEVEDEGLVFLGETGEFVEAFHMISGKWLVVSDKWGFVYGRTGWFGCDLGALGGPLGRLN